MRRGLLLIDRGSREEDVRHELRYICEKAGRKGNYDTSDYCFLEVVPPYIEEGIRSCLAAGIDELTIVPYFLYPGKKVKAAVDTASRFRPENGARISISSPMSMHGSLVALVDEKIGKTLAGKSTPAGKKGADVLLIGHGSKDPEARSALEYVAGGLAPLYRNVSFCFLEIEEPNIRQGIERCAASSPEVLVVVPYFLHRGAHVKRDIYEDLDPAIRGSGMGNVLISEHLGTDEKMVDLVLERAREAEG